MQVPSLTRQDAHWLRLHAQRLMRRDKAPSVADIVQAVVGLQAQEPAAAALGVRVRSDGLTAADVEQARAEDRSVVRLWAMRSTLHLVATTDLDWLLPLLGPGF